MNKDQEHPSQNQDTPMVINKTDISEKLRIPQQVYERIVRNSFEPTQQDMKDIDGALAKEDYETVHRIAHRLKGTYGNLRLTILSAIAQEMNDISKSNPNKERIVQLLNQFRVNFEQMKKSFE